MNERPVRRDSDHVNGGNDDNVAGIDHDVQIQCSNINIGLGIKKKKTEEEIVLFTGNSFVKVVILNRPKKLNSLNHEMICQIKSNLELYENDPLVQLVILKGNGKAFCAGGDVVSVITSSVAGHWTYAASFYKKQLTLDHLIATYKKPTVSLMNGIVMGGGAGLSMPTRFRVVTEKAVFSMPEASIGLFPDVGANYFLSRLPGFFGEYLGLSGARLDGAEIAACGLATHFVPSTEEHESENGAEKWITIALSFIRSSCPTSLKIFLKSGSRAKLFDKDNKPKWEPSKLELVDEEMVNQYFRNINDEEWEYLRFPDRSNYQIACKL
ncbi:3-hydroxyisobutyryl-CoA hydrolase [Vigna angularis]|uniref:3-hydroxyisobutyryl-CoA hydrolase n=1 Tax=Phaseolus angularis TaxID=3914 RepID=A0A8T0JWH0_PHAAN|nr:3-hydroxyisobutyryl-CoA hydrolase [Vigna angularis]